MGAVDEQTVAGGSVEATLAELDRVLGSRIFAHSARLGRFLKFGVESALAGRTDVNEYSIGVDVFGRDTSFDPRIDPIVRVDARRLRTKLREYYDGEGADDRLEICLPLRTYVPVFRTRDGQPAPAAVSVSQFRRESGVRESIGVFPFTSLSADPEGEFFADGLTEELIFALATLNEWRVVAGDPTTGHARRPDLREIGIHLPHLGPAFHHQRPHGSLLADVRGIVRQRGPDADRNRARHLRQVVLAESGSPDRPKASCRGRAHRVRSPAAQMQ
jgi:hypothetical protein